MNLMAFVHGLVTLLSAGSRGPLGAELIGYGSLEAERGTRRFVWRPDWERTPGLAFFLPPC